MGPNVKQLVATKMSMIAIPQGEDNPLAAGLEFLKDVGRMKAAAREAQEFVDAAIAAIRAAPGPNPWRKATDEEIAGEILRRAAKLNPRRFRSK